MFYCNGLVQARFYAGARGPIGPQFLTGPQIFEGFPFFVTDMVFVMTVGNSVFPFVCE